MDCAMNCKTTILLPHHPYIMQNDDGGNLRREMKQSSVQYSTRSEQQNEVI